MGQSRFLAGSLDRARLSALPTAVGAAAACWAAEVRALRCLAATWDLSAPVSSPMARHRRQGSVCSALGGGGWAPHPEASTGPGTWILPIPLPSMGCPPRLPAHTHPTHTYPHHAAAKTARAAGSGQRAGAQTPPLGHQRHSGQDSQGTGIKVARQHRTTARRPPVNATVRLRGTCDTHTDPSVGLAAELEQRPT